MRRACDGSGCREGRHARTARMSAHFGKGSTVCTLVFAHYHSRPSYWDLNTNTTSTWVHPRDICTRLSTQIKNQKACTHVYRWWQSGRLWRCGQTDGLVEQRSLPPWIAQCIQGCRVPCSCTPPWEEISHLSQHKNKNNPIVLSWCKNWVCAPQCFWHHPILVPLKIV